jgi:hypothetical protein
VIVYYVGFVLYVIVCLVVASYGRDRKIGITGFFLIALIFTPIIAGLVLLIAAQRAGAAGNVKPLG